MTFVAGTKLGRYEIRSKIGAGGMGEVYLAHDTKLERTVALKVLPANVAADRQRMQRFIQEAKAASGLNHPNILTIHEIEQIDSTQLIATEFIDGETLRQHLNARRMIIAEALDLSAQIASALSAAHAAGIIHRDIKPENIMLRRDGIVKVLDFGLAKLSERVDPEQVVDAEAATKALVQTEPGVVMGTAAYMSPEQARGQEVDARTDIFSLGVVIYEMLSGRAPFVGETTADTIGALIHKEPQPLSTLVSNVPAELQHIVSKALRKDRDERYQTVKSLLIDLRTLKHELDFSAKLERSVSPDKDAATKNSVTAATANAAIENADTQAAFARPTSSVEYMVTRIKQHKAPFAAGLAGLLLAAISFGYWLHTNRTSNAAAIESIAVLPFINESGNAEVEYLSDGMTESLINSLSQLPSLSVKARSSVFRYKDKNIEPLQVASELSVQAILNGRVVQRGDDLTLYLSLVNARNGNQLWGEQYNRKLTDLVALQSEIARDVSKKLRARLSGTDEQKLTKNYTQNAEAYQHYLKGRYFWYRRTPEDFQKSREYFQRAIDLDPTYALAYSGLADFYGVLAATGQLPPNETWAKQEAIVHKALQLDPHLAEVHNSLAGLKRYYYRDWDGAEQEFKRAIELDPNYAEAHSHYGGHLSTMGRFDEALIERKRAIELDPLSPSFHQRLADTLYFMRRYDEAIEQYRKALELHQTNAQFHERLGNAYEQKGMFDQAIAEWRAAALARGTNEELATMLENTYKESGFNSAIRAFAQERLKQLNERARRGEYIPAMDFARLYVRLGAREQAFLWLEKASEERNTLVFSLKHDPAFDSLRNHTRFQAVLRRVGLPQ
jgi:serine/threonine protein kinase/Tfp pilus assembly protein PilF